MDKTSRTKRLFSCKLLLSLSFITFATWSCSTGKHTTEQNAFQIVKTTAQPWVGGALGSGTGVNYKVLVVIDKQGLAFDSLWTENNRLPVTPKFRPGQYAQAPYNDGDTVILEAKRVKGKKEGQSSQQKSSKSFDGEGLLKYQLIGKAHYFTIDTFQKLPKVRYPTQN